MTGTAARVLDAFESLTEADRQEVAVEMPRCTAMRKHEAPGDDELLLAADQIFLELDRQESER
jgi:hypothetical protein